MSHTSGTLSLSWTKVGAPWRKRIPRLVVGLAVVALAAATVWAVMSALEPSATYSADIGGASTVRANGRPGTPGSELDRSAQFGLGRTDRPGGRLGAGNAAPSYAAYGGCGREGTQDPAPSASGVSQSNGTGKHTIYSNEW